MDFDYVNLRFMMIIIIIIISSSSLMSLHSSSITNCFDDDVGSDLLISNLKRGKKKKSKLLERSTIWR